MFLALLLATSQAPDFQFDYRSGAGLTLTVNDVPLVRGSTFQYYEPGWTKGYYSATHGAQKVQRVDADTLQMTFQSSDGRAQGGGVFRRDGSRLVVNYEFTWKGDKPANVELMGAFLWAPGLQAGKLEIDGKPTRSLVSKSYRSGSDIDERRYGPDASSFRFTAPVGRLDVAAQGAKYLLFDARGYRQDFAEGRSFLWLGVPAIAIAPGQTAKVGFTIDVAAVKRPVAQDLRLNTLSRTLKGALAAGGARPALVPKPKVLKLSESKAVPIRLSNRPGNPLEVAFKAEFLASIRRRFDQSPPVSADGLQILVRRNEEAMVDGQRLEVSTKAVKISLGPMAPVLASARRLAQLVFVRNGQLMLPEGVLEDVPATAWRGVHLFVGPKALAFHKRLWTNVLLPLGFNKVVLQCERTEWECLPNLRGGINMRRAELAELCDWYRSVGVEPIPLVQSFGHAEWLFEKGANRDIAFNPDVLYAIDPRKARVAELFDRIWAEVIAVTKAKTIHFGLDEVDMLGFPNDPKLVTELWKIQVPRLSAIAKKHRVAMMLWGDKGLALGEAIDATLGDDKEEAAARRAVIPRAAFIADWHYKAEPQPGPYMASLMLWEREGFQPIASAWFQPENVRGFNLAAAAHGFGTLQTTWAGYESSEDTMLAAVNQFSAMVLAADYATSGREEAVDKLGYNPTSVFQRMMYARPISVKGEGGLSVQFNEVVGLRTVGPIKFLMCRPVGLGSHVLAGEDGAGAISLGGGFLARELNFACDTAIQCDSNEPVAKVTVEIEGGKVIERTLRYGIDVRAEADAGAVVRGEWAGGLAVVRVPLGDRAVRVKAIRIERANAYSGFRLHGVTGL